MTYQSPQPLRVLFVQTSMPVGGAETLLVNLVRRLDKSRFTPEVVCLKEPGPLGELLLAEGFSVHSGLLSGKYDLRVLPRLVGLIRRGAYAAVVTVGAGDKMFWGRLAAKLAGAPVIASALHSTGWPDTVGRLNRCLTRLTDAFIAVAEPHGRYLVDELRFPAAKVHVIPNGVDTDRFAPGPVSRELRGELGVGLGAPLVGILAALRPEKNHGLFLAAAERIRVSIPEAHFVIIGDGPERGEIERIARQRGLLARDRRGTCVHLLGNRADVPAVLSQLDVLTLTSHNEANPVSLLEGMSCGLPIVATDVGSVGESVRDGETGFLVPPGDEVKLAERVVALLDDPVRGREIGEAGRRRVVERASLEVMVSGYERLVSEQYEKKAGRSVGVGSVATIEPATAVAETPVIERG